MSGTVCQGVWTEIIDCKTMSKIDPVKIVTEAKYGMESDGSSKIITTGLGGNIW